MGILSGLFGGGAKDAGDGIKAAGEGVKTALDGGGGLIKSIRTAITGIDPDSQARVNEMLTQLEGKITEGRQRAEEMTIEVAAQSKSPFIMMFLAGWRPYIGWVAGNSLAAYYLPQYVIGSIVWARAAWLAVPYMRNGELIVPTIPAYPISSDGLLELVIGLSGLVISRSYEKTTGVEGRH